MTYNEVVTMMQLVSNAVNSAGVFLHGRNYDTTLGYDKVYPQIQLFPFTQSPESSNENIIRSTCLIGFYQLDSHENTLQQRQTIIAQMDDLARAFEAALRQQNIQVISLRREPQYLVQMGVVSGVAMEVVFQSGVGCEDAVYVDTFINKKSFGCCYDFSNQLTTVLTQNIWTKLNVITTADFIQNLTHSNNRFTNETPFTKLFCCTAIANVYDGNNNEVDLAFFKNGILVNSSIQSEETHSNNRASSIPIQDYIQLAPNDYLEVWVKNKTASNNIVTTNFNFIIKQI